MFFNTRDPRTQLQARLDCESRSQNDTGGCSEENSSTHGSSTDTDTSSNAHRLFRSGSPDTASKKLISATRR